MTKEEIKLIKEQQAQIEKGYKYQIKRLEEDLQTAKGELSTAAEQVDTLSRENEALRSQIQHLQSGLSGEEISYYED
jgi:regulator of replication initiation timing